MKIEDYNRLVASSMLYSEASEQMMNDLADEFGLGNYTIGPIHRNIEKMLNISYATMGLCGEAGEVANKVKKVLRDSQGNITPEIQAELKSELGDICWYLMALMKELDLTFDEVIEANYNKIGSRLVRGMIKGSGDNR